MNRLSALFLLFFPAVQSGLAGHVVSSVTPSPGALGVSCTTTIGVVFQVPMDSMSLNDSTLTILGTESGPHRTTVAYDSAGRTAILVPAAPFFTGEGVRVTITGAVRTLDGTRVGTPFTWDFHAAAAPADTALFALTSRTGVGLFPWGIASADFDADGACDLAVLCHGARSVTILRNNGNGRFAPISVNLVGNDPTSVAAADLNGDNSIDLAIVNSGSGTLSVLFNDGHGSFSAADPLPAGDFPWSVVAADFDGDGMTDLATGGDSVRVLRNLGGGRFLRMPGLGAGVNPLWIVSADLDGDGDIDIAASNYISNSVSILKNDGDGLFQHASDVAVGGYPYTLAAGDFNADGSTDLAVVSGSYPGTVSIALNDSTGNFIHTLTVVVGKDPLSIVATDMDANGSLDLIVGNWSANTISTLRNDGTGGFTITSTLPAGSGPRAITSADLDGDGDMDLAVANQDSAVVSILKKMNRTFVTSVEPGMNAAGIAVDTTIGITFNTSMDAASLNDSTLRVFGSLSGLHAGQVTYAPATHTARLRLDAPFLPGEVVRVSATRGLTNAWTDSMLSAYVWSFDVRPQPGPAVFFRPQPIPSTPGSRTIVAADMNGDRRPDLVCGGDSVTVMINNGGGGFSPLQVLAAGFRPYAVAAGDLDGDGDCDIASAGQFSSNLWIFRNDGTGHLTPDLVAVADLWVSTLLLADANGDGKLDIVAGGGSTDGFNSLCLVILAGDGMGGFSPGQISRSGFDQGAPFSIQAADFDNDGILDYAMTNGVGRIFVLLGTGDWLRMNSLQVHGGNPSLAAADLNGDGNIDIALTGSRGMETWQNNGAGGFPNGEVRDTTTFGGGISPADFNGDGRMDLIVSRADSASAVLFLNDGANSFIRSTEPLNVGLAPALVTADFDGDSTMDIIFAGSNAPMAVLLNRLTPVSAQMGPLSASLVAPRQVRVSWMTLSENGNYGFYVLRKSDLQHDFQEIPNSFVPGSGTSGSLRSYSFLDTTAGPGIWYYQLKQVGIDGSIQYSGPVRLDGTTDVDEQTPLVFALHQNYPNPFNPETEIRFSVDATNHATLMVYNIIGQEVARLFDGVAVAGEHYRFRFSGRNLASGAYFYRLQSGARVATKRLLLLK